MENRIRVKEAVTEARKQGITTSKTEIATKVYPNASTPRTALVCLNHAERGQTRSMDRLQIVALCDVLDTDANQLFGVKPKIK